MRLGRLVCLAAAALLLVPSMAAQPFDADAVSMKAHAAQLDGQATVIHAFKANGTRILLEAERVHVHEHHEVRAPPESSVDVSELPYYPLEPNIETDEYEANHTHVQWSGRLDKDGYVLVSAGRGVSASTLSASILHLGLPENAHEEARVTPEAKGTNVSGYRPAVHGTLLAHSTAVETEVRGDFTIRYWNGHLGGPTPDGAASYEAGTTYETKGPVPYNPAVRWTDDTFVTLHVENGTLTFQTPLTAVVRAFIDGTAHVEGTHAILYGADGHLASDPIRGTVTLDHFSLLASTTEDGLLLRTPPAGSDPSLLSTAISTPQTSLPVLALAAAASVALALYLRSRRPRTVQMLLDRMDRRQYRRVVRFAPDVMRRTQSEAVPVMKAVALMALGRPHEALRFLEDLPPELRPSDGMDPFLRAHALNESGQADDARSLLQVALRQNPGLVTELSGLPRLRALLPDEAPPEAYT